MSTPATRPEPYVGQQLRPRPFSVTPELLENYWHGLDVEPRDAVPTMLANHVDAGGRLLFSQQRGHLWLRQEWEFSGPLAEGVEYTVEGSVADIYPRRERTILLTETLVRAPGGQVVSKQRHHQSFLLDRPPDAEVVLRDPGSKEGASRAEPVITSELGAFEKTVTLEMCGQFFFGSRNYHSDRAASEELGFRDVVVGGRMTMGYVGELLDMTLGESWARSGRLLVKFTNVLWPGETIRVSAGLGGPLEDDPARDAVYARVAKTDGTVVIVADGSVARQ